MTIGPQEVGSYGKVKILFFLFILMTCLFTGCASVPKENAFVTYVPKVFPGENETAVVIQRKNTFTGSAISMKIWVDGIEVGSGIRNGDDFQIVVQNGARTIQAGSTNVDKGNEISFTADGQTKFFYAEPVMGMFMARFNLTQVTPNINLNQTAPAKY